MNVGRSQPPRSGQKHLLFTGGKDIFHRSIPRCQRLSLLDQSAYMAVCDKTNGIRHSHSPFDFNVLSDA